MNILAWLSGVPGKYHIVFALVVTAVIGYADYVTGYELRMELLYLIPISYVAWFVGQRIGIVFSFLSVVTMMYSDILAGKQYTSFTIEIWNGAIYFVFYVMVALLIELRISLQQRENLIEDLDNALTQNEELSGLLPLCAGCKKDRDDQEYRRKVEAYIDTHGIAEFRQGLCKECATKPDSAFVKNERK